MVHDEVGVGGAIALGDDRWPGVEVDGDGAIELDARKRSRECAGEHTTVVVGSIVFAGDECTETRRMPDRDRRYLEHEFSRRAASGSESQASTCRDGQLEYIAIAAVTKGEFVGPKCVAKQRQLGVGCCDVECAVWAGKSELFATNGDCAIHWTAGGVELQRNVGPSRNIDVCRVDVYRAADLASNTATRDDGHTREARQAEEVEVVVGRETIGVRRVRLESHRIEAQVVCRDNHGRLVSCIGCCFDGVCAGQDSIAHRDCCIRWKFETHAWPAGDVDGFAVRKGGSRAVCSVRERQTHPNRVGRSNRVFRRSNRIIAQVERIGDDTMERAGVGNVNKDVAFGSDLSS